MQLAPQRRLEATGGKRVAWAPGGMRVLVSTNSPPRVRAAPAKKKKKVKRKNQRAEVGLRSGGEMLIQDPEEGEASERHTQMERQEVLLMQQQLQEKRERRKGKKKKGKKGII